MTGLRGRFQRGCAPWKRLQQRTRHICRPHTVLDARRRIPVHNGHAACRSALSTSPYVRDIKCAPRARSVPAEPLFIYNGTPRGMSMTKEPLVCLQVTSSCSPERGALTEHSTFTVQFTLQQEPGDRHHVFVSLFLFPYSPMEAAAKAEAGV